MSVDHVSDAFVDVFPPVNALSAAALEGDRHGVEQMAELFQEHAYAMLKVGVDKAKIHKSHCDLAMVPLSLSCFLFRLLRWHAPSPRMSIASRQLRWQSNT